MKKIIIPIFYTLLFSVLFVTCTNDALTENKDDQESDKVLIGERNFVTGYEPINNNGDLNAVIEIPTGTNEKWEVDKTTGNMAWEIVEGVPRIVKYLGYPGNYGMIPKTILPKDEGGDGDPLDVLVIGPAVERGSILKCKLIGVLKLLDRGEQDDKLIAIGENSPLYAVNSIDELETEYIGITEIISIWFANYKGPDKMEVIAYENKDSAMTVVQKAIDAFQLSQQ